MTEAELKEMLKDLPAEKQKEVLADFRRQRGELIRATISRVMARNNSHNVGERLAEKFRKDSK